MCLYACEGESVSRKKNCIRMCVRTCPSGSDWRCEWTRVRMCAHVPVLYHACPLMSRSGGGEWHDGSDGGEGATSAKLHRMESACHIRVRSVSPRRHPSPSRTASFIYRPLTLFPLTLPLLPLPPPLPLSFPVSFPLHHSLHNFTSALRHSPALSRSDISVPLSFSDTAMAQCRDH